MFENWFKYGETEVVNNERVSAYVENGLKPVGAFIPACGDCGDIAEVTGIVGGEYRTPVLDGAPWYSPEDPDSGDFAGVMGIEVTGISGSTISVDVQERLGDGGVVGARRAVSRTIAVTADLVGRTPEATAIGMEWLASVLHPPCAEGSDCGGDILHLFSACPSACEGITDPDAAMITSSIPAASVTAEQGTASGTTPATRTNLVLNPSFEVGTPVATGWTADASGGGNGVVTRDIVTSPGVTSQTKAQRISCTAQDNLVASYAGIISAASMPLVPGAAFARVDVSAVSLPPGHEAALIVQCRNAANAVIGTFTAVRNTSGVLELPFTAPALTTNAMVLLRQKGTGTGSATAVPVETVWDSVLLVQGAPRPYFDGSTTDDPLFTYNWTSTVNGSTSTAVAAAATFVSFDHNNGATPGRVSSALFSGVCDEVRTTWSVTAGAVPVTAYVQMVDSTGLVVVNSVSQVIPAGSTVFITGVSDPSPGFPGTWRSVLVVTNDAVVGATVSMRPVLTLEDCIKPYRRTFQNVVTVDGPKLVQKRTLGDTTEGSTVWRVEWTWVAVEPHAWHDKTPILTSVPAKTAGAPAYTAPGVPLSAAASIAYNPTVCARPAVSLLSCADNAICGTLILPPSAPVLADPCLMPLAGSNVYRRYFEIPDDLSPLGVGSLSWTFVNDNKPKFGIRVRIYEDSDPAFVQPSECTFIEEFTIDFLAANQTLYIDGPGNDVYVQCGTDVFGLPVYADTLRNLRGNYGGPFQNSVIGCGRPYFISVDVPDTYTNLAITGQANGTSQGSLLWSVDLTRRA